MMVFLFNSTSKLGFFFKLALEKAAETPSADGEAII